MSHSSLRQRTLRAMDRAGVSTGGIGCVAEVLRAVHWHRGGQPFVKLDVIPGRATLTLVGPEEKPSTEILYAGNPRLLMGAVCQWADFVEHEALLCAQSMGKRRERGERALPPDKAISGLRAVLAEMASEAGETT